MTLVPSASSSSLSGRRSSGAREGVRVQEPLTVPRVEKIVLNIGLGEAIKTPKLLEQAFEVLGYISGQRPVVTRAKKSIATFKLREGMRIGCMVTLRGPACGSSSIVLFPSLSPYPRLPRGQPQGV